MQTALSTACGLQLGDALPDLLPLGTTAGHWRIEAELGRGGMGAVYAVVHGEIGKRAALKLMHRRLLAPGVQHADRMLLEARVVNQCRHPNIVDIFDTGTLPDGRPYIVMERLDGISLATRADDGKVLTDRAIEILLQTCSALIAAHDAGIVHRDLKLDNIFLVDDRDDAPPQVKLLDWGIAKEIASDVHQTIQGQLVGTPQYLSPEQARGAAVSPQTDVYSLGVVAWELLLEQLPFEAETAAEVMAMHLRCAPPVPSELWPDIPPELEDLLLAMLEKDPEHRPTMREVVQRLTAVREVLQLRRVIRPSDSSRVATASPLEPLQRLGWSETELVAPTRSRWWQYALGATAIVIAAVMLLVSRVADTQAAVAVVPEAPVAIERPVAVAAPIIVPAPVVVTAPIPVVTEAQPARPAAHPRITRKASVAPHRPVRIDPNGTIDVYQ